MKLEICAGTWDSAKAAAEGGADRILRRSNGRYRKHIFCIVYFVFLQHRCNTGACRFKGVMSGEEKRLFGAYFLQQSRQGIHSTLFHNNFGHAR